MCAEMSKYPPIMDQILNNFWVEEMSFLYKNLPERYYSLGAHLEYMTPLKLFC